MKRKTLIFLLMGVFSLYVWGTLILAWTICFTETTLGGFIPFAVLGLGPIVGGALAASVWVIAEFEED